WCVDGERSAGSSGKNAPLTWRGKIAARWIGVEYRLSSVGRGQHDDAVRIDRQCIVPPFEPRPAAAEWSQAVTTVNERGERSAECQRQAGGGGFGIGCRGELRRRRQAVGQSHSEFKELIDVVYMFAELAQVGGRLVKGSHVAAEGRANL